MVMLASSKTNSVVFLNGWDENMASHTVGKLWKNLILDNGQ